jgi:hypothetical protein
MKKNFLSFAFSLLLLSCSNSEQEAQTLLNDAKVKLENNDFEAAKKQIDSLRVAFPKEFKVLKEGLSLMRLIDIREQERNIAYCDSLLPIRINEVETLMKGFVFEKDPAYDDIGKYIWKQQTVERNLERCYLRAGVNENGEMYLASVYYGKTPMKHTYVELVTKDGSTAKTLPIAYDGGNNYRFDDAGMKSEIVTYKDDQAVDAVKFIYSTPVKERIKVTYKGGSPYVIYLADGDRKAIRATYELAAALSDVTTLNKELDKSTRKIAYLQNKLNQTAAEKQENGTK